VEAGASNYDDRARRADRRDDDADDREADADQRERQIDARERVLDRWEREIAARAAELNILDDVDEQDRQRARVGRERARRQRRDEAEARRDAAIERDIERAQRGDRAQGNPPVGDPSAGDTSGVFARLATALQGSPPLDEVLRRILEAGVETVSGCAAATVALSTNGRLQTAASTAQWAADLDAAQLESGCGPLPNAVDGGMVATAELTSDERWPALSRLRRDGGARGAMSFGLVVGGTGTGVLTMYSDVGEVFDRQALRIGDMLAAHAAMALGRTLERLAYLAQAEAWEHALASRDVIGQAKGILMQQRSVTADEAFHLLRQTSQRLNVKLRDVAQHVVSDRRLPET
jgi:hypothetical protein